MIPVILSLAGLVLVSCGEKEQIVIFNSTEVSRLLSGDSVKAWVRIGVDEEGLSDCTLHQVTRFEKSNDSLKYTINLNPNFCNGDTSLKQSGYWQVYSPDIIPDNANRIRFINNGDTLIKTIVQITSVNLELSYLNNQKKIVESYDYYPPE